MNLFRRIRARLRRRCYFCKDRGWLGCFVCEGDGADCPLCVKGKARCSCPLGEPYAQVILPTTDGGMVAIDRRTLDNMFAAYGIGSPGLADEIALNQAQKET